jgi:PhnB protein
MNWQMERTMQLSPYLTFNGRCEEAFKFYEKCLGGKIEAMLTHAETPMADQVSSEWRGKIVHARLTIGNQALMGSDAPPEHYQPMKGFSVLLLDKDPTEVERIFNALSTKGTIQMPLQKTFWSIKFGMLVDQFGTPWTINCEQPA